MRVIQILVVMIFAGVSVSAQTFEGNKNDIEQILKNIDAFSNAFMSADYETLANSYSIDGKILPPGADIIAGREAIKKRWIQPEGVKILLHKVTPTEIKINGKYAYDIGYYEGKTKRKDGTEVYWKGKYLIVWRKDGKQWKIYADAWNNINITN